MLFCKIDGRVLGGMQFRVLVEVPLCETDGRVLGGMQFAALITVLVPVLLRALMDSGGGGTQFGVLFEVLVMVQAHSCKIDGRMQFGELMQLFWGTVWGAA